jgi:hypothetical protein
MAEISRHVMVTKAKWWFLWPKDYGKSFSKADSEALCGLIDRVLNGAIILE